MKAQMVEPGGTVEASTLLSLRRQARVELSISAYGHTVRLETDEDAESAAVEAVFQVAWGREAFERRDHLDPFWTVCSVRAPALARAIVSRTTPHAREPRPIYGHITADALELNGWDVVLMSDPEPSVTVVVPEHRCSYFIREAGPDPTHVEHLLKYPLRAAVARRGLVRVHAAGCCVRGHGILLPGPPGVGKTTLLLAAVSRGARYLGNDVVLVDPMTDPPTLLAWPHPVGFTETTMLEDTALREHAAWIRTDGLARYPVSTATVDDKIRLRTPALAEIFGRDVFCREAPLRLVVCPKLDPDASRSTIELASTEAAASYLRDLQAPLGFDWLPSLDAQVDGKSSPSLEALLAGFPPLRVLDFGGAGTDPFTEIDRTLRDLEGVSRR
jgi:hypothetical protein